MSMAVRTSKHLSVTGTVEFVRAAEVHAALSDVHCASARVRIPDASRLASLPIPDRPYDPVDAVAQGVRA